MLYHHERWYSVARGLHDGSREVIFSPIKSAKTTTWALIFMTWLIGTNPEKTYGIGCETLEPAQDRVRAVADLITADTEVGRRVRDVFPHLAREDRRDRMGEWGSTGITVRRECTGKDATLVACGLASGSIGGARLDGLLLDNLCGPDTSLSEAGRRNVERRTFEVLLPRLGTPAEGWCVAIDTAWHPEDIMHVLPKHGFRDWRFPADPISGALDNPRTFRCAQMSDEQLAAARASMLPVSYDRQYRLIASNESARIFPANLHELVIVPGLEWLAHMNGDLGGWRVYAGMDLATGQDAGDDTAIFVGAKKGRARRLLHIRRGKWDTMAAGTHMAEVQRDFSPLAWFVESNGQQRLAISAFRNQRFMDIAGANEDAHGHCRVYATETTKGVKWHEDEGIHLFALDFVQRLWSAPEHPLVRAWCSQMEVWTPDSHTGDIMSAWVQFELGVRSMRTPRLIA